MKKIIVLFIFVVFGVSMVSAESLSVEEQVRLITNYMIATNQADRIPSGFATADIRTELEHPVKCVMSPVMDFIQNRHLISKDLTQAMSLSTTARPGSSETPLSFYSPEGLFKIHYTTAGDDAVYQADKDSDKDGAPDYVEDVAGIFEYVYHYIIDTLGYPVPPDDSDSDSDPSFDVYILDIDNSAYGYTTTDDPNVNQEGVQSISSYIIIDNDFARISRYQGRPLEAVKVTAAHEFFHAIHFGLDYKEFEVYYDITNRRYWMEMSSTWMEEEIFDEVNDYYAYIPYFFEDPMLSIQQFVDGWDLHPYAAVVFPIYLSEKFNKQIIHDIWMDCSEELGPNFLRSLEHQLDLIYYPDTAEAFTKSAFPQVFSEFALWNLFTGIRAENAPEGIGYSEAEYYPLIPNYSFLTFNYYPKIQFAKGNLYNPDHNAATYFKFDQLQAFKKNTYWFVPADSLYYVDTTYWDCRVYNCTKINDSCFTYQPGCCLDSVCIDSQIVYDTRMGYDWVNYNVRWCDTCEITDLGGTFFRYFNINDILTDTVISEYTFMTVDSTMDIFLYLDSVFTRPWGVTMVHQLDSDRNIFEITDTTLEGKLHELAIVNPQNFRSVTMIISPASEVSAFYQYAQNLRRGTPREVGGVIYGDLIDSLLESPIDQKAVNLIAEVLYAYPNPAIRGKMSEEVINVRYQVPTDALSQYLYTNPQLALDVFTVNGDYVCRIEKELNIDINDIFSENDRVTLWEVQWDMKNQFGADVAAGIYLIVAKMYKAPGINDVLVEKTTKVAIIR